MSYLEIAPFIVFNRVRSDKASVDGAKIACPILDLEGVLPCYSFIQPGKCPAAQTTSQMSDQDQKRCMVVSRLSRKGISPSKVSYQTAKTNLSIVRMWHVRLWGRSRQDDADSWSHEKAFIVASFWQTVDDSGAAYSNYNIPRSSLEGLWLSINGNDLLRSEGRFIEHSHDGNRPQRVLLLLGCCWLE